MRSLILIVAILSLLSGVRGIQTHKRNLMNLARRQQVQANSTDIDTIFNRLKSIQDGFPSNGFTPPFLVFNSFKANDTNILPPDSAFKNGQIKGVDDEICKNSPKSSDTKSQNEGVTFYVSLKSKRLILNLTSHLFSPHSQSV